MEHVYNLVPGKKYVLFKYVMLALVWIRYSVCQYTLAALVIILKVIDLAKHSSVIQVFFIN